MDIELKPGDCMVQNGDRIGVLQATERRPSRQVLRPLRCGWCGKPVELEVDESIPTEELIVACCPDHDQALDALIENETDP